MQSFRIHKWARTPESEPSSVGITVWGYCHMPMDSIPMCSNTFYMCAVSLNHDIMASFWLHKWARTPKSEPGSVGITVWGYCHMPMDSISMFSNTLYMSNVDGETVWVGCQPQLWCNDIMLTPQVTKNPKIWPKKCGYICLRLLPYAHGQHTNVLKHFVYV